MDSSLRNGPEIYKVALNDSIAISKDNLLELSKGSLADNPRGLEDEYWVIVSHTQNEMDLWGRVKELSEVLKTIVYGDEDIIEVEPITEDQYQPKPPLPEEQLCRPGEPWAEAEIRDLAILYFFGHGTTYRTNASILSETISTIHRTSRSENNVRNMVLHFHKHEWRDGEIFIRRATLAAANAQDMTGNHVQVKSTSWQAEKTWKAAQEYNPDSALGKLSVWHGSDATPLNIRPTKW